MYGTSVSKRTRCLLIPPVAVRPRLSPQWHERVYSVLVIPNTVLPARWATLATAIVGCVISTFGVARYAAIAGWDHGPDGFFYMAMVGFVAMMVAAVLAIVRMAGGARDATTITTLVLCPTICSIGLGVALFVGW